MSWPVLLLLFTLQIPLGEDSAYQEGMRLYEDFEYERAVFRFKEALRVKDRTAADRAVVGLRLGMTYAELRDDQGALEAFENALTEDPLLVLPSDASPKIKALLDEARQSLRTKKKNQPPPEAAPAQGAPATSPKPQPAVRSKVPAKSGLTELPPAEAKKTAAPATPKPAQQPAAPAAPATPRPEPKPAPTTAAQPAQGESTISVTQEESSGGLPWLMISGAGVGVIGAVATVGGIGVLGFAGYAYYQATNAQFADDYTTYANQFNGAIVGGPIVTISGMAVLLTGAALISSSIITGELEEEESAASAEESPEPIQNVPADSPQPAALAPHGNNATGQTQ